ncbi:MAG: sensor domain-containing diguanylate cyclase [Bacillota bacterium]|nr:sensor domain-containing diguanylate cyclase [Bacillota bacterium]
MGETPSRRERGLRRRSARRWRSAGLGLAFGATLASGVLRLPSEALFAAGGATSVLAGGWYGFSGSVMVVFLLAAANAALGRAGYRSSSTLGWAGEAAFWLALALTAAGCRRSWEQTVNERRKEYQALAEEHLQAHERFEATSARLREKNEVLEKKYGEASALLSAVGAIGTSTKPGEIYETIVDTAVKLVPCDSCVLTVLGDAEQPWPVVSTRGSFLAWRKGERIRYGEDVLGWVAKHGQPVVVEDLSRDARFMATSAEAWFRSMIAVPLMIEGRVAAVLGLGRADEPTLGQDDYWTLTSLAGHAAVALDRAYLHQELAHLARTDGLTGLFNRRSFEEALQREISRAKRYGSPLSLLLLDVDHFKHFNDHHGHPLGDKLLKQVAEVIRRSVREADTPARYGGEEFVVLLPETNLRSAMQAAERIRQGVAALAGEEGKTQPLGHFSVSVGVASYPVPCPSAEELVKQADAALYEAKKAGRDRCQACKDFLAG